MNDIQYIPLEKNDAQQSFLFDVQLAPWSNGNWLAWIAALPGCAAWGPTKDEALAMLTQTTQAYLRMLRDKGDTNAGECADHQNAGGSRDTLTFFSCAVRV